MRKTGEEIEIGLEITHLCNKHCKLCSHMINSSPYTCLTREEFDCVVRGMEGLVVTRVLLAGGEPLMHPDIHWLIEQVPRAFPGARMWMVTNGALLDRLTPSELDAFSEIHISRYTGFNDDAARTFRARRNVAVIPYLPFVDPYADPDLDAARASRCYRDCHHRSVRIVQTRVYGCCHAESLERHYGIDSVHLDIRPGWYPEFCDIPTERVCLHCAFTSQVLRRGLAGKLRHMAVRALTRNERTRGLYRTMRFRMRRWHRGSAS